MFAILALIRGQRDRQAIQTDIGACAELRFCSRAADLRAEAHRLKPTILISELADQDGIPTSQTLKALHRQSSWLPIYLYIPFAIVDVREAMDLLKHGVVAGVVFRGIDHPGKGLHSLLARAQLDGETAQLLKAVTSLIPSTAVPLAAACAAASAHAGHIDEVAAALATSPRTLQWQLQRERLPTPQRLLGWCRLLRAVLRLERTNAPLKSIAESLGYSSAAALTHHLKRHAGMTPAMARRDGFRTAHLRLAREILLGKRPR
jgi:AraC-like DNA-binding protein